MSERLLNSIHLCEVVRVQDYGAFARIPDEKQQGLIHRSQVSSTRVDDVSEILQQGERVWCKVISMNDGKIALSMKLVDQGSGRDLDPNGVQMYLDEQKRKKGPDYNKKSAIKLDAVLNVTCAKCGTRGHLAKDCFKGADGKTYELLLDDDEVDSRIPLPVEAPEKAKSDRKDKKRIKKRDKEERSSEKKKGKDVKKQKKQKRLHSTSSSSSSSPSSFSRDRCYKRNSDGKADRYRIPEKSVLEQAKAGKKEKEKEKKKKRREQEKQVKLLAMKKKKKDEKALRKLKKRKRYDSTSSSSSSSSSDSSSSSSSSSDSTSTSDSSDHNTKRKKKKVKSKKSKR